MDICYQSQIYLLPQNLMKQLANFNTLHDGLYGIISYPSDHSINSYTLMNQIFINPNDPNTITSTQSTPDLTMHQAIYFPSSYIFHPSILNPYWNLHHDSSYIHTNVAPPYYIPNLSSYYSYQNQTIPYPYNEIQLGSTLNLHTAPMAALETLPNPFLPIAPSTAQHPLPDPMAQNALPTAPDHTLQNSPHQR